LDINKWRKTEIMTKFVWLIGMAWVLTACNLPIPNAVTPDLIATEVSNMLTSTPSNFDTPDSVESPIPDSTEEAQTTLPATETSTPTATLTATSTASSTPSVTTTPTNADIPSGEPTWKDELNSGTSFGISAEGYDDGNTKILIQADSLTLISVNGIGWRGWRLASYRPSNYYLKADFKTETCSGSDQYGIITQSPDYENGYGYYFGLTCDGRFSIQKWNDSGLSNLEGWSESTHINTGNSQSNRISILKSGKNYKFYVNDSMLADVNDDHFSEPGYFGPFIAGLETKNFTVHLEEIAYWSLP
jgi:hypothetical protein